MSEFCCPVCGELLNRTEKSYVCGKRHCYDIAKSGYVNLLLPNHMNSKLPGDNKLMVHARTAFLNGGYYGCLAEKLSQTAKKYLPEKGVLLDAGCGEGYYTANVWEAVKELSPEVYGIDISKNALDAAAKRIKTVQFGVGSLFRIPMQERSCDLLMTLFAPYCGEEFLRVLKDNGVMIMVIPGKTHLWELKQAVYDNPYENEVKDFALDGFELLEEIPVEDRIFLSNTEDILNLFTMTPYYYKTGVEGTKRLEALTSLETQISFEILVYKKH